MDPLSVAASIYTLLQGAQSGAQGLRKLKHVWKHAADDLENLALEVEGVAASLGDVQSLVEINQSLEDSRNLSAPVGRAAVKIKMLNDLLSSPPLRISRLNNATHARLTWLRHGSDARKLLDDLRVVKMDLVVQLSVVHASSSGRVEQSVRELSEQMAFVIETMAMSKHISEFSNGLTNNSQKEKSVSKVQGPDHKATNPVASNGQDEFLREGGVHEMDEGLAAMTGRTSNYQIRKCASFCSCVCHNKRTFKSPWALSCYIGEFRIKYDGIRPKCSEQDCLRSQSRASFHMTYQSPRYLLRRYLVTTAEYHPIAGPCFSLRMPRVLPRMHNIWACARRGEIVGIQRMFAEGIASPFDLCLHGSHLLFTAAAIRNLSMCRFLIQQGADPETMNERGNSAGMMIWENAFAGHFGVEGVSIVSSMFQDSEFLETRSFTVLHNIVLGIQTHSLDAELKKSTGIINQGDARGRTPLCWAVIRNNLTAVNTLLASRADPNVVDEARRSPIDFVTSSEVCQALLTAGADIRHRSSIYQLSPLHRACRNTNAAEVVDLLVNAGIAVDVRTTEDETPLHEALCVGHLAAARRLIELGADVNAANKFSRDSALHFATSFDHHQIMPLILSSGVNIRARNALGRTVLHFAADRASTRMLQVLADAEGLEDLPAGLRDETGRTAADYMKGRIVLTEREEGLHEQFDRLLESLEQRRRRRRRECSSEVGSARSDSPVPVIVGDFSETTDDVEAQLEYADYRQLPGAYPGYADKDDRGLLVT